MWGLFIFGTYNSDNSSLIKDIYPYIIFLWLNILEKKAILFLQEKQKNLMEKDFQVISFKRPSGKTHTLKLSSELEKSDILKNLDEVCRKQTVSRPKLQQKCSLPIEQLKFGDGASQRDMPSKSLDPSQMKSIKKHIPLTLEIEGLQNKLSIKQRVRPVEDVEEEEKKEIFPEYPQNIQKYSISLMTDECDIHADAVNLNFLKVQNHFTIKNDKPELMLQSSFGGPSNKNTYKLQNFYKNKKAYLKYEIILGSQYFLIRIFLIIFLVNSDLTYSIFAILYLVIVLVICLYKNHSVIDFIKNFTLTIIPIHYLVFLLNINSQTSPSIIPNKIANFLDVSFVHFLFGEDLYEQYKQWITFLGLGMETQDFTSFILVSMVICFLQIYFMYYFVFVEYIIKSIDKRYEKYEKSLEDKESQLINYKKWKKPEYRFVNQFYNFLHQNVHLFFIFFLCFFCIIRNSLPNFVLLIFFLAYIILCELGFRWPYTYEKLFFIKSYFRVIQLVAIFFLFLIHFLMIPKIADYCNVAWCYEITEYMSQYDKLIALLVLQLGVDLISYERYAQVCYNQCNKKMLRVI